MTLALRVLGPLEAGVGDVPAPLGPRKQRALLAHLAVRANEEVPVARLVDELWPEGPPETAEHAIQVYVSALRKALGDRERITRHGSAYALRLGRGQLDLDRFRELVAEARGSLAQEPSTAAERLREASKLWRGRALADLDGEPGVRDLVLALEEERLEATELRLEAELGLGRHSVLVAQLERLLAEHPAREALYRLLMRALYRSGRQAEALEVYRRARTNLRRELGVEPSRALRELEAAMLRQDPSLAVESPELRARRHLPPEREPLAGREQDVAELVELLGSGAVRLVTLTGPTGAGKTTVAIACAERAAASFRDGVWYVDLGSLEDATRVAAAIAEALGVEEPSVLTEHLRERELLLVLDGFERVRDAAWVVGELLREAPRLKLLVVGASRLRLYGEHEYELAS